MRVLVTGATGFAGRWLTRELEAHGHVVVPAPDMDVLDIGDVSAVRRLIEEAGPDAIAHLAGMAFAGDARTDPGEAFRVNVGGTAAVLEAAGRLGRAGRMGRVGPPVVLVTGSGEVYGRPRPEDLPLRENAPLLPVAPYGLSKLAQEAVALEVSAAHDVPVVVTRAFNHVGPGQRAEFVVPALARRVLAVRAGGAEEVRVGNADVRRDFTDVRDVVRAYRLLLEAAVGGALPARRTVVNVASGRPVSIRWIAEELMRLAGCDAPLALDQALVRPDDPEEIAGDATLLASLTGWMPGIPLERTLADVLDALGGGL